MTVAQLISEWLNEAGENQLSKQIANKLASNEFAQLPVLFGPCAGDPCREIVKWGHEHSFVRLDPEEP